MDFSIQMPTNPLERRRLQNRIAQRKFRRKSKEDGYHSTLQVLNPHLTSLVEKKDQSQGAATDTHVPALPVVIQNPGPPQAQFSVPSFSGFSFPAADSSGGARSIDPNIEDVSFANISGLENCSDIFASNDHLTQLLSNITDGHTSVGINNGIYSLSSTTSHDLGTTASMVSDNTTLPNINGIDGNATKSSTPWLDDQLNPAPYSEAKPPHLGTLSALHIAAQKGNDKILRVLLQHHDNTNEKDSDGRTPLMHATMFGHLTSVQLLLTQGARIDDVDNENRSCLHWAILYRRRTVLEVLLDHYSKHKVPYEVDINAYDAAGWTPLHMAIDRGFEAGVILLLNHGANVYNKAQKCPYSHKPSPAPAS